MRKKLRSNFEPGSPRWATRRAQWRALGLTDADMEKPKIAVVNSSSELASCFSHLDATGARRSPAAPDIPAAGELFPGYHVQSLNGVVVPSATPRELVQRLHADFLKAMQLPEMKTRMAEFGLQPVGNSPAEFDALIRAEIDKWARVTKAANIKVD